MTGTGAMGGTAADSTGYSPASARRLALFGLVAAALLVFAIIKGVTEFLVWRPALALLWMAICVAGASSFFWVEYKTLPDFARRLLRASALFVAFYFLTEPLELPASGLPADSPVPALLPYLRWLGFLAGAAAWFRPSFMVAGAMILWVVRGMFHPITGALFSTLDIQIVIEFLVFAGTALVGFGAARAITLTRSRLRLDEETFRSASLLVVVIAMGAHFGNYFYSAIAKLTLEGGVFSWVAGNRLYDSILGGLEKGTFPFAASPALTQIIYDAVRTFNIPMHIGSLTIQFVALFAFFNRRLMMALTGLFDLFHLFVYLTVGLFFWKWIALNSIILVTLAKIKSEAWTRTVAVVGTLTVLFGFVLFTTARLGWYNAPSIYSTYFEAETATGERYRVPSSFFGTSSYQVSQGWLYSEISSGDFNHSIWTAVYTVADLEAARKCAPMARAVPDIRFGPLENVARFAWLNHDRALKKGGADGRFNDRLYIHHHMPSPFTARPFDKLDKRDITAYYYMAESVCLSLEKGRLRRNVLKRVEYQLPRPGNG
ncbi:MAG: hypothetical protein VX640_07640 [Pseudomonadota bacterium]|nr:hypothetical protein [Pseudomonadota bacterium]